MDIKFWKDKENGIVMEDLFSQQAEKIAKDVFYEGKRKKNNPSQLRRFYDEVLKFKNMIDSVPDSNKKEEFEKIKPYLFMINSKVSYAEGRELITEKFRDFIKNSLNNVKDVKDFEVFMSLFESFMGFYKYYFEIVSRGDGDRNRERRENNSNNNRERGR